LKARLHPWGTRLADAMRAALERGDTETALRLARDGDGQARDLAREHAFMMRGLCLTLDVLLGQVSEPGAGDDALAAALLRFLRGLHDGIGERAPEPLAGSDLHGLAQACRQALATAQKQFGAGQARLADEAIGALIDGQPGRALEALAAKDDAWLAVHDPIVRFMADVFAWALDRFGEQGLLDFHLATAEGQRAGFVKWEQMPAEDFAATTAFLLRQHMGQVRVEEDAQRFTIRQSPCGSGGRLRLLGAYEGPGALPWVETAGPLTFGEPRMPVYCTHCAIWNGSATLRWFGRAHWVFDGPARTDGSCTLHLYKRREDAPADYARRVGLGEDERR
jgi:hypothetical protein